MEISYNKQSNKELQLQELKYLPQKSYEKI